MDVYASWNGSTETATWEVLEGNSADALVPVARAARDGFETRVRVESAARFFAVRAIDASGAVLSTSPARRVQD